MAPMRGRELVALNVRRIRVARSISQERLAYDAGVDRSYLGGVERAEANPTLDVLDRLAQSLNIPLIDLFVDVNDDQQSNLSLPRGRKPRNR